MSEHRRVAGLLGELLGHVEVGVFAAQAIMLLCGGQEKFVRLLCLDFLNHQNAAVSGIIQTENISEYLKKLGDGSGNCYWEKYYDGEANPSWQIDLEELSKEHRAILRAVMYHLRDRSSLAYEGRFEVQVEDVHQQAAHEVAKLSELAKCCEAMDELVELGLFSRWQVKGTVLYGLRLEILRFLVARFLARPAP